jgi:hypothetical protein
MFQYVSAKTKPGHFTFRDFAIILTFLFAVLHVEAKTNERIIVLARLASQGHLLLFFQFRFVVLMQMLRF